MVSITDITRRFRVHDYVVEIWMEKGILPECVWCNGRRYWESDDINALISGCPVVFSKAASSIKTFSRRSTALTVISSVIAFIATLASN